MGHTQPSACVKACHGMCVCPVEPPPITSQYRQTPLRRRNIPNCLEGEHPKLSGLPSPHNSEKRKKAQFRTLFYSITKMSCMKHSSGWVLLPLALLFSPFFLCAPTAQPPQAPTRSSSTPGPVQGGPAPPSTSLSLNYTSGNLDAKTKLKAKISLPKVPGQTPRESSSSTLPAESVDEPSPCAGCPICRV